MFWLRSSFDPNDPDLKMVEAVVTGTNVDPVAAEEKKVKQAGGFEAFQAAAQGN